MNQFSGAGKIIGGNLMEHCRNVKENRTAQPAGGVAVAHMLGQQKFQRLSAELRNLRAGRIHLHGRVNLCRTCRHKAFIAVPDRTDHACVAGPVLPGEAKRWNFDTNSCRGFKHCHVFTDCNRLPVYFNSKLLHQ